VLHRYQDLQFRFLSRFSEARSKEFALHGFSRRIGTLRRCIQNVYALYAPTRADIPDKDTVLDLTINLQSFLFNLFGAIDNLARIWVVENEVVDAKGRPLPAKRISFKNEDVRASLNPDFLGYMDGLKDWLDYLDSFRHALAHRVPPYIPPYNVRTKDAARYSELDDLKNKAALAGDVGEYERLDAEQMQLAWFVPGLTHAFSEAPGVIAFHAQVIADSNTLIEIAENFLAQPNW
jgi:hypothetical protein